jgi:CHAT domain-containing protein
MKTFLINRFYLLFIILFFFVTFYDAHSQSFIDYYTKTKECIKNGEYKTGIIYGEKSLKEAERLFGKNDTIYAECCNDLGSLYRKTGLYDKAEPLLKRALNIRKKVKGEDNFEYASSLNNLALLYKETNRLYDAEEMYLEAYRIFRKMKGIDSSIIAVTMNNLGTLYIDMGQYDKSEPLILNAIKIHKETIGEEHIYYMNALHNLASLYVAMGNYEKAEPVYYESLRLKEKYYGKDHPDYALSLSDLANLYSQQFNYSKSESLLVEAIARLEKSLGVNDPSYAVAMNGLAYVYNKTGRHDEAKKIFEKVIALDKQIYGDKNENYTIDIVNLAETYLAQGQFNKAASLFKQANDNTLSLLKETYTFLSEREKILLLIRFYERFNEFYSLAYRFAEKEPTLAGDMLNLRMTTKEIALSSTVNVRNRILRSGDSTLIKEYNRLTGLREIISQVYSLTIDEQKQYGINLDTLKMKANEIEKRITKSSGLYTTQSELNQTNWKEVQKKLKQGEASVEFVDFSYYELNATDTVYYCAIILTNESENPYLVKLCRDKELEALTSVSPEKTESYVKNPDVSLKLYNLIWKPIETYLKNTKVVYISSAGLLNKISFASLSSGNNELICDKYKIRYVGNTKDIFSKVDDEYSKIDLSKTTASIFGGSKFDLDSSEAFLTAQKFTRGEEWNPPEDMNYSDAPKIRATRWNYLPGTLDESNRIKDILENGGVKVNIYTGADASENALKLLNFTNSPTILHIASHGYFFPSPSKLLKVDTSGKIKNKFMLSPNALLRSGLILSGANRVWCGNDEIDGIENGILTAMEISNLDLINTELVVLSACETGLGDIYAGEGVFGLQRAFKVAGAKTIIMSLWKVPDKETVELMELFYTNWLSGMTKHEAFNNAQKEMRKKYPPYYWAAFIMVE